MGYFRYFIKCIIRNIAWRICKPRNLLIISIICIVLALFTSTCFASEATVVNPTETMEYVNTSDRDAYQYDDQFGHLYTMQNSTQQKFIANLYANKGNPGFDDFVYYLFHECKNLGLSNKTLYVLPSSGTVGFTVYYAYIDHLEETVVSNVQFAFDDYWYVNVPVCTGNFTRVGYIHAENNVTSAIVSYTTEQLSAPFACLSVFNPSFIDLFKYYGLITDESSSELEALNQKAEQTNNSLNIINSTIDKQNQLQQEQNEILTDDNVNTEGLEFATDDTVDPTADGFNSLFNTVYNAFCNTASEPLTITLPYINETFTIQPNIVSNGMQKAGLGVIVTLISSFYYFSVCLFIYKDISKIVENLKSGNITSDCGNVKTEVL